ncbi:MAG TPA: HdeD family acid-resistance protein [Candidatus Limnocylindria bacterium]|jgi:uncharacterized membrane protein HdeD (DUF308 family)|nr:HdeD family acid-resistance protein [Candidatus Limnocylindria bacterium]
MVARFFAQNATAEQEFRKEWGWLLAIGIIEIAVGVYCLTSQITATLASVVALGVLLFVVGVAEIVGAFRAHGAGHVILFLLGGLLSIVVGLALMSRPGAGALTVTLLLAAMLVVGGIYRFWAALAIQFPHYGWAAISGVLSCILGVLLWAQWPISALWFIGFIVGLNFIFTGAWLSSLAFRLKNAPGGQSIGGSQMAAPRI